MSLSIESGMLANGFVGGGAGGFDLYAGSAGKAVGGGVFLQGNENLAFTPAAGETVTVSGEIAGEARNNLGASFGSLTLNGRGKLNLAAANTFIGGVTIDSGTLELGNVNSVALPGVITFAPGARATALLDPGVDPGTVIKGFDASDSIDIEGFDPATTAILFPSDSFITIVDGARTDNFTFDPATLNLAQNQFHIASDHAGGSILSLRPSQMPVTGQLAVGAPATATIGVGHAGAIAGVSITEFADIGGGDVHGHSVGRRGRAPRRTPAPQAAEERSRPPIAARR